MSERLLVLKGEASKGEQDQILSNENICRAGTELLKKSENLGVRKHQVILGYVFESDLFTIYVRDLFCSDEHCPSRGRALARPHSARRRVAGSRESVEEGGSLAPRSPPLCCSADTDRQTDGQSAGLKETSEVGQAFCPSDPDLAQSRCLGKCFLSQYSTRRAKFDTLMTKRT